MRLVFVCLLTSAKQLQEACNLTERKTMVHKLGTCSFKSVLHVL